MSTFNPTLDFITTGCDGTQYIESLCENFGNTSCCLDSSSGKRIKCADKFNTTSVAEDFADEKCKTLCLDKARGLVSGGKCLVVEKGEVQGTTNCASTGKVRNPSYQFANEAYGEVCQRSKKTNGDLYQGCDGEMGQKSKCKWYGNPTTCCTEPNTKDLLVCNTAGFSQKPEEKDFDNCNAECKTDTTRRRRQSSSPGTGTGSSSSGTGTGASSGTVSTYKMSSTVTVQNCSVAKKMVSAQGKTAFKEALTESMFGITVTDTQLSTVNCAVRLLKEDIRSLTAKPGVKADYTYTTPVPRTPPTGETFKNKLNTALSKNGVAAVVESATLTEATGETEVSASVSTQVASIIFAISLMGISW